MSSGAYAQGIAAYDEILAEYGDVAQAYLGRGRARLASGAPDGGLADLMRAHEIEPKESSTSEEIGDIHYSRDAFRQASDFYQRALDSGGLSPEGHYHMAISLVQLGEGDAAVPHAEATLQGAPNHSEARFLYGRLLNERSRFAEAEKELRAAEAQLGGSGDFNKELGLALLEQSKLEEAEELAREFIRSFPSDARARTLLGEVYLQRQQFEAARNQLIRSLRIDPNEPRAQLALGRTWLAIGRTRGDSGDLAKARQILANATGIDAGDRLLALGQIELADGDLDGAKSLLDRALDKGAESLAAHLSLAEAHAKSEDLVGAAEHIQRASQFAPEDPAIPLSLAIVYSQLRESERAAENYLKAIRGAGLVAPAGEDSGPVMLPEPYVPVPDRFNLNRSIRSAYEEVLKQLEGDPIATELQSLTQSTTFVLGTS